MKQNTDHTVDKTKTTSALSYKRSQENIVKIYKIYNVCVKMVLWSKHPYASIIYIKIPYLSEETYKSFLYFAQVLQLFTIPMEYTKS